MDADGCGDLAENTEWLFGVDQDGDFNRFVIGAPVGHFAFSRPLTAIRPGEFFACYFQIQSVGGESGFANALEILYGYGDQHPGSSGGWVLKFKSGQDAMLPHSAKSEQVYSDGSDFGGDIDAWNANAPDAYLPGRWNRVLLDYCRNSRMRLWLNDTLLLNTFMIAELGPRQVVTRAIGLTVHFSAVPVS